jgi:hypothetical protein
MMAVEKPVQIWPLQVKRAREHRVFYRFALDPGIEVADVETRGFTATAA